MKSAVTVFFQFLLNNGIHQSNLLLGRCCLGCGVSSQWVVCKVCSDKIKKPKVLCRHCGIALSIETQHSLCKQCLAKPPAFERLDYLANYEGDLADWIVAAKVGRQVNALEAIKLLISSHVDKATFKRYQNYALLPVPIPKYRLMQRGFNLPLLMTKQLSKEYGMPVVSSNVVLLPRYVKKQARLSKKQREKRRDKLIINGHLPKKVLIVDDVVTTTGTVSHLTESLRKNGVESVAVWALARTQWS